MGVQIVHDQGDGFDRHITPGIHNRKDTGKHPAPAPSRLRTRQRHQTRFKLTIRLALVALAPTLASTRRNVKTRFDEPALDSVRLAMTDLQDIGNGVTGGTTSLTSKILIYEHRIFDS